MANSFCKGKVANNSKILRDGFEAFWEYNIFLKLQRKSRVLILIPVVLKIINLLT